MACGVVPFQMEQHRRLRWLRRLAAIAVTQANLAVYVYTKCDEYFNVTGLLSSNLAVLMAVLCLHLVILEALAYMFGDMDSRYMDPSERDRSSSDPETSLSSGIGQHEVEALATPPVSEERDYRITSSCYQLLQPSNSVHPTATDINTAAARRSNLPYDVIRRYSTTSVSDPDAEQRSTESREEKPITAASHVLVTSSSAIDVIVLPRCDEATEITDNTLVIASDNRKELKQETTGLFTLCADPTMWRPRDQPCVTRAIDLLYCVYVVVDVAKAVCCIVVLRRLFLYLFLYYWRLSTMNIITVFVSPTVVIVFEVSLTVAGFILQYEQLNSDPCLRRTS